MSLLVLTKGIGEVYVTTVEGALYEEVRGPDGDPIYRPVALEKCGKDEDLESLRRENEILRNVILKAYRQFGDIASRRAIA